MAPNMKANDRFVDNMIIPHRTEAVPPSLDDVQAKLVETEKEADKARKDSKIARDEFNDIRKQR